jgi:hypothetical protein
MRTGAEAEMGLVIESTSYAPQRPFASQIRRATILQGAAEISTVSDKDCSFVEAEQSDYGHTTMGCNFPLCARITSDRIPTSGCMSLKPRWIVIRWSLAK